MSGIPGTVGRPARAGLDGGRLPRLPALALDVPALALRIAAFLGLALFAALHWAALIAPAPNGRTLVAIAIAVTGGVLIASTGRLPRAPGLAVRIALVVLTALITLTVMGIPFKLLMPKHWGTLEDRVGGGLAVVGNVTEWPYGGPNVWLRLTTLMAAPLVLTIAAALTFWPRREGGSDRRGLPMAGLVLLVTLYGVSVAARPLEHDTLRGLGLLIAIAAWLWMPRLRGRDAVAALAVLAVAGVVGTGLTARVASDDPWVDYRQWSWSFNKERTIAFDWRHSYGPLDWPREGKTLLLVKSQEPHYWKAETLDRFDGRVWTTVNAQQASPALTNYAASSNPKWLDTTRVTIRGLRSDQVVGPGTILDVSDAPGEAVTLANATYLLNGQLGSGDSYTVRSYNPDPTSRQMRSAGSPDHFLTRFTVVGLPRPGGFEAAPVSVPLRGQPWTGDPNAVENIDSSRYAPVRSLAERVAQGAPTQYDIVRRIGAYLEENYTYSEEPPARRYPLEAFLFDDKIGYCQQFSGAAALMLRMLGIPTRVATGFAPGTLDRETKEYVVRDLDAHSWIEVWFDGLGWVPFDPTPADSPASSQATSFALSEVAASAARGNTRDRLANNRRLDDLLAGASGDSGGGLAINRDEGTPWVWVVAGIVVGLLVLAALFTTLAARRREHACVVPDACGDTDVDGLVRLMARLGLPVEQGTTLYQLEQRLQRLAGPDAGDYARRLRRRRFADAGDRAPTRAERRHLRQTLVHALDAGLLTRVRLLVPTGPKLPDLPRPRLR